MTDDLAPHRFTRRLVLICTVCTAIFASIGAASAQAVVDPQVAAGSGKSTCAIGMSGKLTCFGDNSYGELGFAPVGVLNATPTVAGIGNVKQVVGGQFHSCALLANGLVYCMGRNDFGQLGSATNLGNSNANPTPMQVAGLANVVQLAAGQFSTCALLASGGVVCWGLNDYGQLGNTSNSGNSQPNGAPLAVTGINGAVQIASGDKSVCARLADGTAKCWGDNTYGQLANSTTTNSGDHPTPADVESGPLTKMTGIASIAMGGVHSCFMLPGGVLACAGNNNYGALGTTADNGSDLPHSTPIVVPGLSGVQQVSAGGHHTCVLLAGGAVQCFGYNNYGQLGNGANNGTTNANPTPATVAGLPAVVQVSAGFASTCALALGGDTYCWGINQTGTLGAAVNAGTIFANPSPIKVVGLNLVDVLLPAVNPVITPTGKPKVVYKKKRVRGHRRKKKVAVAIKLKGTYSFAISRFLNPATVCTGAVGMTATWTYKVTKIKRVHHKRRRVHVKKHGKKRGGATVAPSGQACTGHYTLNLSVKHTSKARVKLALAFNNARLEPVSAAVNLRMPKIRAPRVNHRHHRR